MKVSVIIPTYNRGHYISEAINSVLAQDIEGCSIEIIVVDDGSTDNTREITKGFGDKIIYIYQENKGAGAARNRGIENVSGEWIAFLDSDDRWLPHKLSLQFDLLKHFPECQVIHGNFHTFDETGIIIEKGLEYWVKVFTGVDPVDWSRVYAQGYCSDRFTVQRNGRPFTIYKGNIFKAQLYAPCVSCWTLLIHRDLLGTGMKFAENYPTLEDQWFVSSLAEHNDFVFADVVLAENRGHRGPRLTQAQDIDRLKTQIDIVGKLFIPSQSKNRPPDEEVERQYQNLHIKLFKEYLKKGMRFEARKTYDTIKVIGSHGEDRMFWLYRITSLLPFDMMKFAVLLKRFLYRKIMRGG